MEGTRFSNLSDAAVFILNTADANKKVTYHISIFTNQRDLTIEVVNLWKLGEIKDVGNISPPLEPARPTNVQILPPNKTPKRGKGGTLVPLFIYK
jgi:hypothetical protein